MEGEGRMLVIAVGKHSLVGRLNALLDRAPEETPLQTKLGNLAKNILCVSSSMNE
jgi:magnesium-transporting ATPase (P-type)